MAYLIPTDKPLQIETRPIDWVEALGTWATVGILIFGLWQTGLGKFKIKI